MIAWRWIWPGVLAWALASPPPVSAQGLRLPANALHGTTLEQPAVVAPGETLAFEPVWGGEVLFPSPPTFSALDRFERHGPPVWDPSSGSWYVWANGAIVRLDGTRAVVVADGVQGRDVDVRAARGVAVSREPDHSIVLWKWADSAEPRRVLLRGNTYFRPRLSPDASLVLVQEARAGGGRLVLVSMDGHARDLGFGSDGVFTPDGRGVILAVVTGDGHRIVEADLVYLDLASGRRTWLTRTPDEAEVHPAVSPDGRFIAFVDARAGSLCVARMPPLLGAAGVP